MLPSPEWLADSTWAIALGRFHPMVLHLPIGAFVAVFTLELVAWFKKPESGLPIFLLWGLTATTATLASVLGWLLSTDGYGEGAVDRHETTALIFTGLVWLCFLIRSRNIQSFKPAGKVLKIGMLLCGGVMGLAGHEGGNLTHGENYLFEKMPEGLRSVFIHDKKGDESFMLNENGKLSAVGILQDRCVSCHGEKKQKGDYRLDTREYAMMPGESGRDPIVKYDAMSSYLVRLITYGEGDDEVMPPAKKKGLTSEEILTIVQWVDAGAPWSE